MWIEPEYLAGLNHVVNFGNYYSLSVRFRLIGKCLDTRVWNNPTQPPAGSYSIKGLIETMLSRSAVLGLNTINRHARKQNNAQHFNVNVEV